MRVAQAWCFLIQVYCKWKMQISCHSNSKAGQSRPLPFHLSSQRCTSSPEPAQRVFDSSHSKALWGTEGTTGLTYEWEGESVGDRKSCGKQSKKEHVSDAWWEGATQVNWDYSSKNKQASKEHICFDQPKKENYALYFFVFCHCQSDLSNLPCSNHPKSSHFDYWI